jgi:hypothetical protein
LASLRDKSVPSGRSFTVFNDIPGRSIALGVEAERIDTGSFRLVKAPTVEPVPPSEFRRVDDWTVEEILAREA